MKKKNNWWIISAIIMIGVPIGYVSMGVIDRIQRKTIQNDTTKIDTIMDPTPVDSTPVKPTPVKPTPVDPTPVDPAPVKPTPVDPAPVKPTPVDPAPVKPTPVSPTPTLEVDKSSINYSSDKSTNKFKVTSNVSWDIKIDYKDGVDWLSLSTTNGKNNKNVTVSATKNTGSTPRNATIIVSGDGLTQSISVDQAGFSGNLTVDKATLNFGEAKSKQAFAITSNVNWDIKIDYKDEPGWLTLSSTKGQDNKSVSVTATKNSGSSPRNATITVSGEGITQTIDVSQKECAPIPPKPTPNPVVLDPAIEEEIKKAVASGQNHSMIPGDCKVLVNEYDVIDYQNFKMGVRYHSYTNVNVTSVQSDSNDKVTKIHVTAHVAEKENDSDEQEQ